jgi:hypothetical protein
MNPNDFRPVYEWENGQPIQRCRALVNRQGKNSTVILQFLAKPMSSRTGLEYLSWAINDGVLEHIKNASNPRIKVMLEAKKQEDWDEIEDARRLLTRTEFLCLIENYARPFPGGDYCTFGEQDIRRFHENPQSDRSIWRS